MAGPVFTQRAQDFRSVYHNVPYKGKLYAATCLVIRGAGGEDHLVTTTILGELVERFTNEDAAERFRKSARGSGCASVTDNANGLIVFYRLIPPSLAADVLAAANRADFSKFNPL